jgi:tetratricopeptide (TPR) repeat protein
MSTVQSRDRTLPRLLASKAAAGASGVLQATRGKLKRVFCLEEGWLVFGASNLIEEQLEEYLVRQGALSPGERAEAAVRAADGKNSVIAELIRQQTLTDDILRRAMEGLIRTLLTSCLEWPDGDYRFASGRPDVSGKVTVRLSPVQYILEHARHYPASIDAVRARLGPPDIRPRRTDEGDKMLESIASDGATRFILEGSDGSRTLGELLADCPAAEDETLRSLYALFLVGALDESAARRKKESSAEAPLSEEECVALLRRADGADHYGVLGLDRRATRDLIREAYYSLARRYHPDRFRSGDLSGFLGQMEKYFTQVTEAYNTLYSDSLRKEYDQQLDELPPGAADTGGTAHLARQNYLRAKELIERRRFSEAAGYLENAVRQNDSQAEYHLELGELLAGNPRRRADAEEHLLRAAELDPSLPRAYLALGQLYRKAAREADAARMFREVLRWDPGNAEAAAELSRLRDVGDASEGLLRRLFGS